MILIAEHLVTRALRLAQIERSFDRLQFLRTGNVHDVEIIDRKKPILERGNGAVQMARA